MKALPFALTTPLPVSTARMMRLAVVPVAGVEMVSSVSFTMHQIRSILLQRNHRLSDERKPAHALAASFVFWKSACFTLPDSSAPMPGVSCAAASA